MTRTAYIVEDSTETLITYPPSDWLGVPSSADVRIGTAAVGLPEAGSEDAATVDSVSSSTNAAAEEGATSLSFAGDPSATPGRLYLVEHAAIGNLIVEVVSSGTTTYLAQPLPCDVPSGATFKGIAVSHALTAAETAESGRALAIWRATIDGTQRTWEQPFRVVPRAFSGRLTSSELMRLCREWPRLRPAGDLTDQESIDSAHEWLIGELEASGYLISRINSVEKLNLVVVRQLMARAYEALEGPASENAIKAEENLQEQMRKAKAGSDFWYDRDDDDDVSEDERDHPADEEVAWVVR